jgi:hypothetical protein
MHVVSDGVRFFAAWFRHGIIISERVWDGKHGISRRSWQGHWSAVRYGGLIETGKGLSPE